MKILVQNIDGLKLPEQANAGEDAAYDIFATTGPNIIGESIHLPAYFADVLWRRVAYIEYGTNLFIAPEPKEELVGTTTTDGWDGAGPFYKTEYENELTTYHTLLFPRSSVSKQNLLLANSVGLVDGGYRNQIFLRFKYIFQPEDFVVAQEDILRVYGRVKNEHLYQKGDKIVQIMASPNIPIEFERVPTLPPSKRNLGGFGASGR